MNSSKRAFILAGLSVFFWSTVATAFKLGLREYSVLQLIFYMSLVTVVVLFVFLIAEKKIGAFLRQTPRQWLVSALLGAFNPLAYYLILFKAYDLLPAQVAQPLNMVWPITLALLSVPFLGQKIGWRSFAALGISFVGVVLISSQGGSGGFANTNFTGVLLALGSSLMWASYWIFNVRDRRDETLKLFSGFLFGLFYLVIAMLLFSDFRLRPGIGAFSLIYIGLFEAGITYILWMKALQLSTNNARIGNLVFLAPFLSLVFIRFILKEEIYFTTFAGLLFIVGGILFQQSDRKKKVPVN